MALARLLVLGFFVFSAAISQADAPSGEIIGGSDFSSLVTGIDKNNQAAKLSDNGKYALLTHFIDPVLGKQDGIYDFTSKTFTAIREADSSGVLQRIKSLYDFNSDGSTVVGQGIHNQAITWQAATGVQSLTGLSGETVTGYASQISSDGSIIYGWNSASSSAFRWTALEGFTDPFAGAAPAGGIRITGASADGAALVGISPTTNLLYYWSQTGGVMPISASAGFAPSISSDGSTYSYSLQTTAYTYVTTSAGTNSIFAITPLWLNDDGSLLFGMKHPRISTIGSGSIFDSVGYRFWTEDMGTTLTTLDPDYYISTLGYDIPTQYGLGPVFDVSADGKTFLVGGSYQGYNYAVIHVPEVGSLMMLGSGGLALVVGTALRRRRGTRGTT